MSEIKELEKRLAEYTKKAEKAFAYRASLPIGSSRAKVTTANARWITWSQARDKAEAKLEEEKKALKSEKKFSDTAARAIDRFAKRFEF